MSYVFQNFLSSRAQTVKPCIVLSSTQSIGASCTGLVRIVWLTVTTVRTPPLAASKSLLNFTASQCLPTKPPVANWYLPTSRVL